MDKKSPHQIYGVLGFPAKHSLSHLMQNAAFAALKIDAEYRIFEKRPEELEGFLHSLSQENIFGLNVTVPYKEKVIPYLASLSPEAKLIGAVNTVRVSGDKLGGFNTDGDGFLRAIKEDLGFNPQGKVIALLGAGGAAKAVAVYLSKTNPKAIRVYDIDRLKAAALVGQLKENFENIEFNLADSIEGLKIEDSHLLINATPVGMKASDPCLVPEGLFHKNLLAYDLIYNPRETKLLKTALAKGAQASNGLGMLLYQGAIAFELWTGKPAPVEIMREALNQGAKKL